MQVILLSKEKQLGNLGELIDVKSGYARNYLLPKGKAILATKKNIEIVELQKIKLKEKIANKLAIAQSKVNKINSIESIIIKSKSGEEGKLFGSIGTRDIAEAITLLGVPINKNEIRLPNGKLRYIGEHQVIFHPHNEVTVMITIHIVSNS
ncbi:50S ribosomal protein L9 [Buchnera aphidicola]|uniref:50S ribosomal protein L9 n=1 Tax=Buchnera aphidicola TaxID=9 RepID=UPI0034639CBF